MKGGIDCGAVLFLSYKIVLNIHSFAESEMECVEDRIRWTHTRKDRDGDWVYYSQSYALIGSELGLNE